MALSESAIREVYGASGPLMRVLDLYRLPLHIEKDVRRALDLTQTRIKNSMRRQIAEDAESEGHEFLEKGNYRDAGYRYAHAAGQRAILKQRSLEVQDRRKAADAYGNVLANTPPESQDPLIRSRFFLNIAEQLDLIGAKSDREAVVDGLKRAFEILKDYKPDSTDILSKQLERVWSLATKYKAFELATSAAAANAALLATLVKDAGGPGSVIAQSTLELALWYKRAGKAEEAKKLLTDITPSLLRHSHVPGFQGRTALVRLLRGYGIAVPAKADDEALLEAMKQFAGSNGTAEQPAAATTEEQAPSGE